MKSLINKYKNNIKKIISTMTGCENEDIEQEVYIKTWKNMDKYKEQGKFKSWINTITANLCRDYLRSNYFKNAKNTVTQDDTLLEVKDEKANIELELIRKQRNTRVIKAINELKPKLKEVIIMYEIKEMSYEEISKKLKCPIGTIRSRLFTARKELYTKLKDLI